MKNNIKTAISKNRVDIIIWIGFIVLLSIISFFHEPWFDEAESWQIARCASYREILFSVPHYEGHPPLWHLILSVPAKLGLPYELSLKTISILFSSITSFLIIFKSPIPTWIRRCIPFTYFMFYQYGVVVRTYCVMGTVFMLTALTFKDRNQKPFRFALCLLLLCLTSAYGIAIAGGIAVAWVIDIVREKGIKSLLRNAIHDVRVYALTILLVGALCVIGLIIPKPETMALELENINSIYVKAVYALFGVLADCTVADNLNTYIQSNTFVPFSLVCAVFIGIIIGTLLIAYSCRENIKYFVIPYSLFAVMVMTLYFCRHHEGIIFLFIVWYVWINSYASDDKIWGKISVRLKTADRIALIKATKGVIAFFLIVSIGYSMLSAYYDIIHPYSCGRQIAEYLQESGLTDEYIMATWYSGESDEISNEDTNIVDYIVNIAPYFDDELVTNLNPTEPWREYLVHRYSEELNEENKEELSRWEAPAVLIGSPDVSSIYPEVTLNDYVPVYEFLNSGVSIWKGTYSEHNEYILVRRDLLDKYGLKEIEKHYVYK